MWLREPNCCHFPGMTEVKPGDPILPKDEMLTHIIGFQPSSKNWHQNFSQCALWDCGHIGWGKNLAVNNQLERYIRDGDLGNISGFGYQPPDAKYDFGRGSLIATKLDPVLLNSNITEHFNENGERQLRKSPYASGIITTRYDSPIAGSFIERQGIGHGRIEVTAKLPKNTKAFPAIWAVLAQQRGEWISPYVPEIDIMEAHGFNPFRIYNTVHDYFEPGKFSQKQHTETFSNDFSEGLNKFGIDRHPMFLAWHINGFYTHCIPTPPSFRDINSGLTLVINHAIGGNWVDLEYKNAINSGMAKEFRDETTDEFVISDIQISEWNDLVDFI